MRTLAIGDIHGCFRALQGVVEAAQLTNDDRLVTLGDYVDRGSDSCAVLDWLIARSQDGNLVPLRGNHELMMLDARSDSGFANFWLVVGGQETLDSYSEGDRRGGFADVHEAHWRFFTDECRDWFETPTHIFVHGNLHPHMALQEQPHDMLFWEKFNEPPPHQSGKTMVCGHTPQESGRPLDIGHAVCIDTDACRGGWLTCLDVDTGQYWQANEAGEVRSDWLQPSSARS